MFENITLIANPISGGRKDKEGLIRYVLNYFSERGIACTLKYTTRRGEATEFSRQAVKDKSDAVVVIGGDGTINEAAASLINTNVAMGIIPIGSGNGLARSLGIPKNVKQACELISRGPIVPIDVGRINQRFFFLVVGVGFDAVVGKSFDEYNKRGPFSYFYLSAKTYFNYKPEDMRISFNDKSLEIKPFVIAVANGQQYGNNAIIAPQAKLNDGLLNICIFHRLTFLQVFTQLPKLFLGKIESFSDADFYESNTVSIQREGPSVVNIDGEAFCESAELRISVLPQSLNVIVSKNSFSFT